VTVVDRLSCPPELAELEQLEAVIERDLHAFIRVGQALLAIKDGKRYIAGGYSSFEDYAFRRWTLSRSHAYRLVDAAGVVTLILPEASPGEMSPRGDVLTPDSEGQVRSLAKLRDEPAKVIEAWTEAVEVAGGQQPTASDVAAAVAKRLPPKLSPPPRREPTPEEEAAEIHAAHIRRCVERLERFCSGWDEFRSRLADDRAEIVAALTDGDRQIVLQAELQIEEGTVWKPISPKTTSRKTTTSRPVAS
jgi:hypothetical protein